MKYKKTVIIFSVILGVIALGFLLSYTLFRTNNVELNFKNQSTMFSENDKTEIISTANISYGSPIFFTNKTQIKSTIEKKNPFIKVINIETVFPNKLVVHVAQREEFFAIMVGDAYCICDEELKVLDDDVDTFTSTQINAVLLTGVDVINKTAQKGDFLKLQSEEDLVKKIANAFAYNNKTIADIKGMFKQMNLTYETNFYTRTKEAVLTLTTFDDFNIVVDLPKYHLVEKFNMMLAIVPKSVSKYKDHQLILEINPFDPSDVDFRYKSLT